MILALLANIRLGLKWLKVKAALALFTVALFTMEKSFEVQAQEGADL
jgi:hypothetical protein